MGSVLPLKVVGGEVGRTISGSDFIGATIGGTGQVTWATGEMLYASALDTLSRLSGNTTTTKKFLTETGTGSAAQAPAWSTISPGDLGTGTPSSSNFLRGDGSWQPLSVSLSDVTVGTLSIDLKFPTSGSDPTSIDDNDYLRGTSGGICINTGNTHKTRVFYRGVEQVTVGVDGFRFINTSGTVTAGAMQLISLGGSGMVSNVPSNGYVRFMENGAGDFATFSNYYNNTIHLSATNGNYFLVYTGSQLSLTVGPNDVRLADASNYWGIYYGSIIGNTPNPYIFYISATERARITTAGIDLSTNSGGIIFGAAGTAGSGRGIWGTSTGLVIGTSTLTTISLYVAGGSVAQANGHGLAIVNGNFIDLGTTGTVGDLINNGLSGSGIVGTSSGVCINSGAGLRVYQSATLYGRIDAAGLTLPTNNTDLAFTGSNMGIVFTGHGDSAIYNSNYDKIYSEAAGYMNINTGTAFKVMLGGTERGKFTSAGIDLSTNSGGIIFGAAGTADTSKRGIWGTSTGLVIQSPSSTYISGFISTTEIFRANATNFKLYQDLILGPTGTPSSNTDTGTTGQIKWDSSYIYLATNTNTWGRASISWSGQAGFSQNSYTVANSTNQSLGAATAVTWVFVQKQNTSDFAIYICQGTGAQPQVQANSSAFLNGGNTPAANQAVVSYDSGSGNIVLNHNFTGSQTFLVTVF
jgi:hypothetical protein